MKTLLINLGILAALSLHTASALPTTGVAQKAKTKTTAAKTVIGYISDSSCGLAHMAGMNEKDCTLMCVKMESSCSRIATISLFTSLIRPDREKPENLPVRKSR